MGAHINLIPKQRKFLEYILTLPIPGRIETGPIASRRDFVIRRVLSNNSYIKNGERCEILNKLHRLYHNQYKQYLKNGKQPHGIKMEST